MGKRKMISALILVAGLFVTPAYGAQDLDCSKKLTILWHKPMNLVNAFYFVKNHAPDKAEPVMDADGAYFLQPGTCFAVIGVRRIKSLTLLHVRLLTTHKVGYIFVNWD